MKLNNAFIYLVGIPAVGKYSTAKEIARLGHTTTVDNQLVNTPIFSILGYNGKDSVPMISWRYISKIRQVVLGFIRDQATPGMSFVFTSVLEDVPRDRRLFRQIERIALYRGGVFVPVFMTCDAAEIRRRKRNPDRTVRLKDTDITNVRYWTEEFRQLHIPHPNALFVDTTNSAPTQTARLILKHVRRILRR